MDFSSDLTKRQDNFKTCFPCFPVHFPLFFPIFPFSPGPTALPSVVRCQKDTHIDQVLNQDVNEAVMASPHLLSQAVNSITSFGNAKAASTEVTQFVRPTSSPTDTLVPFTYTKARIPQMDFSRKPAQNPRNDPATCRLGLIQAVDSTAVSTVLADQGHGPETGEQKETPATSRSAVTCAPCGPDAGVIQSDAVEPLINRATSTESVDASATRSGVPAIDDTVDPSIESARLSSTNMIHQSVSQPQMKADKVLRKHHEPTKATLHPKCLNDGELLSILLSRHRAEQQNREKLQASQQAKDQEINDLKGVSHTLYEQLQIVKGREHAQQIELSKFHIFKEKWDPRIQLLKETFQSLTDDHHKLEKDAIDMREQQKSIYADKAVLEVMLKDVHQAFSHDRARTKKILLEARHEMELLEQTVESQDKELQVNTKLLDNEHKRSQVLEAALSSITKTNEDLTNMFAGHKDVVIEKLTHLLRRSETQVVVAAEPQNDLKPVLDQCLGLLKDLHKVEMVKPQDFVTLNRAVRSYANRYVALSFVANIAENSSLAKSMYYCESTAKTTQEGQQRLSLDVQNQLSNLSDNINVKHALGEQLMDLREVKATIRERLLASEASLVEARQHVAALENKEQFHLRRISELETGYAGLQSKESEITQMNLKFQEAEVRNQSLQAQLTDLHNEASGTSKSLEQKIEEITGLTARLSEVQSQLEEARTKTATFAVEKVEYESQAAERCEKMRKQLNQAASLQLEGVESKYLNQLKQLRQEKTAAEARVEQQEVEAESSNQKRVAAETKAEQVKLQLERLQTAMALSQSYTSRNATRDAAAASPNDNARAQSRGSQSHQTYSAMNETREAAAPSPKDNPGTQSRRSQSRGQQDALLWHPVRSTTRPGQPDRPDPSSVKRGAGALGDDMAPKRARKLVSQGLGPVIPDSQSQSPKGTCMAPPRNMRRLSSKVVGRKPPKQDKYERRFSQELEID